MKRNLILPIVSLLLSGASAQAQALLPYQNPNLSAQERAEDLVGRLTLEQKVQLMMDESQAIKELGIKRYAWWNEALHGAARSGLATVFPQAIGMAASWNPQLLHEVFDIASTEQRIKFIQARKKDDVKRYTGLTVWTPNINIFRDPRWGRGQETYGEDPYLTMRMGEAVVNGLQGSTGKGEKADKYDKLHACLKHYAVHSGPEYERHIFNAENISYRDMAETYLYAFEQLVKRTDVKEVMCAYNAVEGKPCCGSDNLLTQILRNEWGFDGLVVSDCWAIRDFYDGPEVHNIFPNDPAAASANAVLSGTDVECGSSYSYLPEAVERGAIQEKDIDVSVRRLLRARFELGEMDADSLVSWNLIPESALCSDDHHRKALQMARESMVLLQNRGNVLPFAKNIAKGKKYLVVGPNANDSLTLWGNYYGTPARTITVLEGIRSKLGPKDKLVYDKGSEWVLDEVFQSRFNQCSSDKGQGFFVTYYNNTKLEGRPIAQKLHESPFQLCTSGATVFAPDVPLENFSGRYETIYRASDKDEELTFNLFACGEGEILVAGDTLISFRTGHGARRMTETFKAEAGKEYPITINFRFLINDAQLNFDLGVKGPSNIDQLLAENKDADAIIYVGGISPLLEGEEMKVNFEGFQGGDRTSIQLPAIQRATLRKLHATGKPVVFVNMSGSAIGLAPETETCDAILQAWYGGEAGGQAVADVLFGDYNPAGRLPITFYDSESDLPDFGDYNMKGHTYRYFEGRPVFAFGEGLSYSKFAYRNATIEGETLWVTVENTSDRDGEEVVQLYIRKDDDKEGPLRTLRGFSRVSIKAGQRVQVPFLLDETTLATFHQATGKMEVTPGNYTLYYGGSSRPEALKSIAYKKK